MQVCQDRQINFPDIFIPQKGQQRHFPLISAASRIQDNAFRSCGVSSSITMQSARPAFKMCSSFIFRDYVSQQ